MFHTFQYCRFLHAYSNDVLLHCTILLAWTFWFWFFFLNSKKEKVEKQEAKLMRQKESMLNLWVRKS
jgi:hypothetical protein